MWSVADAKAHLSEVLRRARGGAPQIIGAQQPCVVVSVEAYRTGIAAGEHDGRWLASLAGRHDLDVELPPRAEDRAMPRLGD
jgi:prevent-host-death family protein